MVYPFDDYYGLGKDDFVNLGRGKARIRRDDWIDNRHDFFGRKFDLYGYNCLRRRDLVFYKPRQ